jgi:signal transduction histidine kinase/CheY-like chemotaxis protein
MSEMSAREILIVEDDATFRKVIRRSLAVDGYSFAEADSVDSALAVCSERQSPSVILLDLQIPGGSGREFLRRLGSHSAKYRIIVLTAHEEYLAAEVAREFQVFRYLHKPSGIMEALRFTVAQAFRDIEREQLIDKNAMLVSIQQRINEDIQETNSSEGTRTALHDVLKLICESLRQVVGAYTVHIRIYNLQTGDFHLAAFAGPSGGTGAIFALPKRKSEPLSGAVASQKRSINYQDLQGDQGFKDWKEHSVGRLRSLDDAAVFKEAQEYFDSVKSAFIAPISTYLFADEVDAVVNVSSDSANFFTPAKQEIVIEFVGQTTAAITKAWEKLRKRESHQDYRNINRVLEDISKALRSEDAKREIYEIVIRGISAIIKPEAISIYLNNKTTGLLDNQAEFRGETLHEYSRQGHPTDEGLTALVFSTGRPLRVPNLQATDRRRPIEHPYASKELSDQYVALLPSGRVDHYLAVPMIIGDEVIGAIQLLNKKSAYYRDERVDRDRWLSERGFSDDCENVLGIAASHLAVAIKNAELLEERRKQISQLAILKDVGRFTSSETLRDLLQKMIRQAAEQAQAELCLLFLLDESKSRLVLVGSYGISERELPEANYQIGEGLTGRVAATGVSQLTRNDVPAGKYDQQILRHLENRYGQGKRIESLMIVPIIAGSDVLGVIKIINKRADNQHYNQDDLLFFKHFASYVGLALENKQRYEAAVRKLITAESNATMSHLVRAVIHEINNSQALIPLKIQHIRESMARSNFDIGEMIDVIEEVAAETLSFANSIQAFEPSRLKEQQVQDLNAIIQKAFNQVVPTLEKHEFHERVKVDIRLSPQPLMCAVYETPFIQVIQNIIINAYQSMEKSATAQLKITSSLNQQRKLALISFADTGCGIKEEYKTRIFEADFTTKGRGTGIGLWLAKRHLDSIDARIMVASKLNEGTTFDIEVPLAEHQS